MEKVTAKTLTTSGISKNGVNAEVANATGVYTATCYDSKGNVKWSDTYTNLVTTVGKNALLDTFLAGSGYTAAWYLGLVNTAPTYDVTDTSASHAGWTEVTAYSEATRNAPSWGSAAAGAKATTATAFSINGTATIAGTFLIDENTKGGTTGVLYSAGSFTGGDKSVASGDTLNVTYTASV